MSGSRSDSGIQDFVGLTQVSRTMQINGAGTYKHDQHKDSGELKLTQVDLTVSLSVQSSFSGKLADSVITWVTRSEKM